MWFELQGLRKAMRGQRATAIACLLLALFVLQGAVARGHFHFGAPGLATTAKATVADASGKPIKTPLGHDEANCPLLHAAGIGSTAVAPVATLFFVPPLGHARAPVDERTIFVERFAAHWRSRAPPTV